jgi:hypothetical protein
MKTRSSTPLIVGGALTALVALAALAGAAGLLWVHVAKNDHGFLTTGAHELHTSSRALVSHSFTINSNIPDWFVDKVRVNASGDKPLFVGVARQSAVRGYLAGVSTTTVKDIEAWSSRVTYADHAGTRIPSAPGTRTFWKASSARDLRWDLRKGRWAVVVMNADGSPGVTADVAVGAKVRGVLPTGIVLAVLGALLAALAGLLITRGSRVRAL